MPKSYSGDLRERVIEAVEIEGASRREAAERFGVSVSFGSQMAAALERKRKRSAETARRKRISIGSA
jgi:transposase